MKYDLDPNKKIKIAVGDHEHIEFKLGDILVAPDTKISLPELQFGLVPGAGGTVSVPRRIGRQRTNWLAMSGMTLDAETALEWGLVDELADPTPAPG